MRTYRAVMLTRKGGPEVLQVVELPLPEPGPGQLRVRVRAAGVGATDLTLLDGSYPFAPRIPFVPGYEVAGVVDAVGTGVSGFSVGQRVAALTVWGGYAEYLVREAEHFLTTPDAVSDPEAAAVILNYVTAWQMIHRTARVAEARGERTGVRTLGAASAAKHATVRALGATPIDYRAGHLEALVRAWCPAVWTSPSTGSAAPTSARASAPCAGAGRSWATASWERRERCRRR
jgi:D-arabinose 1-dehydrogenase-like Zn-dependent alcohol dehydrogenase